MSILVWNNAGAGSLWSTAANWVGGIGPIFTDTVQFDATSVADSSADTPVAGVDQQATYSGTVTVIAAIALGNFSIDAGAFDFGSLAVSIIKYSRQGGTVTGSSDVLTITGDTLITGGTFVHNSGRVDLTLLTGSQDWDSTVIDELFQFRIAKQVWDLFILNQKIEISDRFIIDNFDFSTSPQLRGTIDLIGTATLEQNGNLLDSSQLGIIRFVGTTHEWIQNNTSTLASLPAVYVDCISVTLTEGVAGVHFGFWKLTTVSGILINAPLIHINKIQQFLHFTFDLFEDITFGQLTWIAGNFDLLLENARTITVNGDVLVTGIAGGTQFSGVGSTLAIKGNYSQTGSDGNISTVRVLFNGTGIQNISNDGSIDTIPTNLLEIDKPSGSVRLLNSSLDQRFTNDAILVTNGTFDVNGFDVSVRNDLTMNGDFAGLGGSTITVLGNFAAVNSELIGGTWFLNVTGTSTAQNCNIGGCNANGGVTLLAQTSVNFGFNFNVLFGGEPEDPNLFFRILQHLWPISRAFDTTKQDKQFTELNQALTFLGEESKRFNDDVYGDLFPDTTRELDSWEQQWNLPFNSALTEQERRDRLASAWSSLGGQSPRYIQDTIQGAGFTNVFIHEWWDLAQLPAAVAHDPNVILQNDADLLVNIITFTVKDFITGLDQAIMECGEVQAQLGQYTQFIFSEFVYEIPDNPALYPYFLYFGDATFPNRTTVPADREAEFKQLLLKICPAQQWLGLLIDYV